MARRAAGGSGWPAGRPASTPGCGSEAGPWSCETGWCAPRDSAPDKAGGVKNKLHSALYVRHITTFFPGPHTEQVFVELLRETEHHDGVLKVNLVHLHCMLEMKGRKEERTKHGQTNNKAKQPCTCAVLLCLVCLFDLACFFLSSFSSLI